MEPAEVVLVRQEERLATLERELASVKEVQTEIRTMNETLITLAAELKRMGENLQRHERQLDGLQKEPRARMQQIGVAVVSALVAALATAVLGVLFR